MQNIVIDRPYRFVAPVEGNFWPRVIGRLLLPAYVRRTQGIHSVEYVGTEKLAASVRAGHGVLITPNHCRPPDPMLLFPPGLAVGAPMHVMASRHLFEQSRFQRWLLRHMGVFSVYREGMDREALKCAVRILVEARRPLVLFPEGVISRTNDRLNHLMDGTGFIARNAARQRAALQPPGRVVVHPVAIRYFFMGDLDAALRPVLDEVEHRLTWKSRSGEPLKERIIRIGEALLCLKETEYLGQPQAGELAERIRRLIDHILVPLETEWLKGAREGDVVGRIKALRAVILPDMVAEKVDEAERKRRWVQLADLYLVQQLAGYPPGYFSPEPTPERLLETVERFEEDLTDHVRIHRPMHAAVEVGDAIDVPPGRDRGADGDPLMDAIRRQLETMLEALKARRPAGKMGRAEEGECARGGQ